MKKLRIVSLIIFFGILLVGCQMHIHNYKTKVIVPTCTEQGFTIYTCSCGDSYQGKYIKALGHNYSDWVVVTEATETDTGLKERKCNRCNDIQKEEIPCKKHTHKYSEEVISPTCIDKGYTKYTCSCGDSYQDNEVEALGHTEEILPKVEATCTTSGLTIGKKCSVCEEVLVKQEEIKALGHSYGEWNVTKEATEETTGLKERKCNRCNDIQTEVIQELEHTHKYNEEVISPTCVNKGYTLYTCSCGNSYKDNYKNALGHKEEIIVGKAATCTESGLTIGKKCSVCGEILLNQEEIKAKGHTEEILPKVEATCTTSGLTIGKKCLVCEEILVKQEEIEALGHNEIVINGYDATCTTNGLSEGTKCSRCNEIIKEQTRILSTGHNYLLQDIKQATCTEDGYIKYQCSKCNDIKEQKQLSIGHYYIDNVCIYCGDVIKTSHTHSYTKQVILPTCIEEGYTIYTCSCGNSYKDNIIEQTGHRWNEGEVITPNTCTTEGKVKYTCTKCNETYNTTLPAGHNYSETITINATCTEDGRKEKECTQCHTKIIEIIKAHHTWETQEIIEQPTCVEKGSKKVKCSVCNEYSVEEIKELGHLYKNGICERCGKHFSEDISEDKESIEYGMYFGIEDVISNYGPDYINEYGVLLDYNKDANITKVAVYLTQEGTMWRRCIAVVGTNIKYATYVPYLAYDKEIKYTGLNSSWIKTFSLSENKDGIWCYSNYTTIGVNLEDNNKNLLLSLYDIAQSGSKTKIFTNLDEMIEWLKKDDCEHIESDWIIDTEATCTKKGSKHKECSVCKKTLETEEIGLKDHNYSEWIIVKEATEDDAGLQKRICLVCNFEEEKEIPKLTHVHHYESKVIKPTCTENGYTLHTCKCGDSYKDNEVKAKGHTEKVIPAVAPTCTNKGKTEGKKCSVCNTILVKQTEIEALGHKVEIISGYDATCTESGLTIGKKCTVCNTILVKQTEIKALGHSYGEWVVVKEATEDETGLQMRTCSNCNFEEEKEIAKLSHVHHYESKVILPTCIEKGYTLNTCKCGYSYKDNYKNALGHTEVVILGYAATCTTSGLTEGKKCSVCETILVKQKEIKALGHTEVVISGIEATCTTKGKTKGSKCSVCETILVKQEEIKALGHNYKVTITKPTCVDKGYTLYQCSKCNHTYIDNYINALGHTEVVVPGYVATCTEKGKTAGKKCSVCKEILVKQEEIKALGHSYGDWVVVKEATETDAGLQKRKCLVCNFEEEKEIAKLSHEHHYESKVIKPTCVDKGYTLNICKCGDSYKDNEVKALGHTEVVILGYAATCTEKGLTDGSKCSVCETILVKQKDIKAKGHTETEWIIDSESTCTNNGSKHKECNVCNEVIKTETIPSTGHSYKETITKPTCVDEGYTLYQCSKCNYTYIDNYTNALGHKETSWIIDNVATCTVNGSKHKECSVCKEVLKTEVILATGHSYKETITKPTCTTQGFSTYQCSKCNDTYKDNYIDALGHTEEVILGYAATCTTSGLTAGKKCFVCNTILLVQEEIKAKGHTETEWIIDTDSTCIVTGSKHKECSVCKEVLETEEIGLKDHNYIDGKCSMCGKKDPSANEIIIDNGYVYFGKYPQSLKEDSVTVSITPDSDGYYMGSDGERYAKVEAKPWSSSYVFNDKTTSIVKGRSYYFKVEPIKWKILEQNDGTYRLISTIILDAQMYYSSSSTRTIDGETIYANNYEYSDIRKWLNNDFLNKAFTEELQTYIATSIVDNSLSSTGYNTNFYACNNTLDKIYLLSAKEINDLKQDSNNEKYEEEIVIEKQLTDYAKALGCYMNTSSSYPEYYNNGYYWLRSPYYIDSSNVRYVINYGNMSNNDYVYNTSVGVAPALTINLNRKCDKHQESEWIIFNDATCTNDGLKYKECSICKELLETEIISSKGHTESDWIIDVEATCSIGLRHKECIMCKKTLEIEETATYEHNYIDGKCSVCGSINDVLDFVNGYIYFGKYPQTLKEESVTVSSNPDCDGYYMGSDGERYAKVEAKPFENSYVFNDKTTSIVKGNTYYFKVEPIKWKIESENNGTYKLISTIILDNQMYYSSWNDRTIDGETIYANNYEYSDIRKWLNNDFLNKAFTEELQTYIATSIVDNSLSSTGYETNKYICNNTLDKIYLPSYKEMTNTSYGYSSDQYEEDIARQKQLTDYAKAIGCYMNTSSSYYNNGLYWLRSPSYNDSLLVRLVSYNGNIYSSIVIGTYVGVAPALSITIK